MDTRRFAEVSVLHLEPETYARLLDLAQTQPGRPGGFRYDAENPWHNLIVEPHTYGCWVHTGAAEDGMIEGVAESLIAVLREALASDATWVLFDSDLMPMLDLAVFEHPEPIAPEPRRVVFSYLVPVCVAVEDGEIRRVTVIDETPIADPEFIEGDRAYLAEAVTAARDAADWPGWRFGW